MSASDSQVDVARRPLRDRLKSALAARSIDSSVVLPASWVISGAFFGLGSALILQWSPPSVVLAAGIAGVLAWLARGVANLVLACFAMLILIAVVFRTADSLFPAAGWSLSWLSPCALGGVIALLLLARRLAPGLGSSRAGALIELIAATVSLFLALKFVGDVSSAGDDGAALFLLRAEDNDAWINLVGNMRDSHGATELTGSSFVGFGPVVAVFLAGVRAACSGIFPSSLPLSSSSRVVLSSYGLLIATAPIVVALVVRRMFHLRRPIVTLLVWGCATTLVISYCLSLVLNGFLTATLTILLILATAYLISAAPRFRGGRTYGAWLATLLLLFGTGSAWVALIPLAGAAIAVCCVPVLNFARKDLRRALPAAATFVLAAVVLELELLQQYHDVADPVGGSTWLLEARGGTPVITVATQTLMFALLVVIGWLYSSRERPNGPASERGFVAPLLWLVSYIVVVLLAAAWVTGELPSYGPTKLQFEIAGVWVALAVIEVVSRLEVGRRQLNLVAVIVLTVLWASIVQNGPIYGAVALHWPEPVPKPEWLDAVQREAKLDRRVLCMSTDHPSNGAYLCNRFASSLQGKDDGAATVWRSVALGVLPVYEAMNEVRNAKDKPWVIVVVGPVERFYSQRAWWAPIVRLPGLKFVPVSGQGQAAIAAGRNPSAG